MSGTRCSPTRELLFLAAVAALAVAGCQDTPTVPDPPQFLASPGHQWAGGTVAITASGGAFRAGDFIVRGTDTLAVVSQATESVSLPLPTDANGRTTLEIWRDGRRLGEATLDAYGFEGLRVYPARIDDTITELPVPFGVSVVGRQYDEGCCGDSGGGFVWIFPSTGMHRWFPGTPDLPDLYRVGVDPESGTVYYEWDYADNLACDLCKSVHAAKIVGGELTDLGWISRPCDRWSCEPLAGDRWIFPNVSYTCRVTPSPAGDTCETIEIGTFSGGDPRGIERLWSAGVAIVLGPNAAFRLSSGELAYHLPDDVYAVSAAPDEARGIFYVSARTIEYGEQSRDVEILRVRGERGSVEGAFPLTLLCPADSVPQASCDEPDLGYDPVRDVLYVLRGDTRTLEVRDAETFERRGEVALRGGPDYWTYARVLVDSYTDRVFLVFGAASRFDVNSERYEGFPGTPVIEVRLPPE